MPISAGIWQNKTAMRRWAETHLTGTEEANVKGKIEKLNRDLKGNAVIPACTYACPLADPEKELHILIICDGSIHTLNKYEDSLKKKGWMRPMGLYALPPKHNVPISCEIVHL